MSEIPAGGSADCDAGVVADDRGPTGVLQVLGVRKYYGGGRGLRFTTRPPIRAVDGVSFTLAAGEALGVVGESGCGKSTLAKLLVRLESPTDGQVMLGDEDVHTLRGKRLTAFRRRIQIVFQDPYTSLNPRMKAVDLIGEALDLHPEARAGHGRRERILELMALVGLAPEHAQRYPHQFSGGQRQRIGIARALALDPEVLVLDEPVSALDVSVQAQVINLLEDLRERLGLSYILISHDLSVVAHACDRVAVMYAGKIVEIGAADGVFADPEHPYTEALVSAIPVPDPRRGDRRNRIVLTGDVADAAHRPSGCPFRTRCWKAQDVCAREEPALIERGRPGRLTACHFADHDPGHD